MKEQEIPTMRQISTRRYYLKGKILEELKNNTKKGFYQWLSQNTKQNFSDYAENDIILNHKLEKSVFYLIVSTKELLKNAIQQAESTNQSYLATDATYKLISCQFIFSTIATITKDHEIADIAYFIHSNEDTEAYIYALTQVKETLKTHFNIDWSPKVYFPSNFFFFFGSVSYS